MSVFSAPEGLTRAAKLTSQASARLAAKPFQHTHHASFARLRVQAAAAGGSAWAPNSQLLSLLAPALDLLSGRHSSRSSAVGSVYDQDEQLCRLTYRDGSTPHTPMPEAVRRAFAALEQDDEDDESGNTLCLVTYSEEDGVQLAGSSSSSGRSAMLAFARLNETYDAAALVSPGGVMDTLCLLSYDEDA